MPASPPLGEKLQKILAQTGIGSRRTVESYIQQGRIKVDGKPAHLGQRITRQQRVQFDEKIIQLLPEQVQTQVILYHKPAGEITSQSDPEGRPTVFEQLPPIAEGKWINVGRLDINTSGLLLFTNDGKLAHRLTHPSQGIEREYAVRVFGEVSHEMLQNLTRGVNLDDGPARFEEIVPADGSGRNQWFYVLLKSGRNRLVRRLWESQPGLQVSRLMRVRFAHLILEKTLAPGATIELGAADIDKLKQLAGLDRVAKL